MSANCRFQVGFKVRRCDEYGAFFVSGKLQISFRYYVAGVCIMEDNAPIAANPQIKYTFVASYIVYAKLAFIEDSQNTRNFGLSDSSVFMDVSVCIAAM